MAKSKKTKENNTENIQESLEHTALLNDETVATLFNEDELCENPYPTKPDINDLSMMDLLHYYEACKILCTHYDREMKINELEKRNYTPEQIRQNREKYTHYVSLHTKIREHIENKLNKLLEYENW